MNGDPENFESLRRLLAWKRQEQPPPGYFNDFSRRVIARIEAGERGADRAGWSAWVQRVWLALQARPAFAGAFGAAVCAFLVVGMVGSEDAPMTYRPDSVPNQAVLGTVAHSASAADAPGVLPPLLDRTNSPGSLAALFNESLVVAEPAKANTSLIGGH
jgi:hypothetical protein